MLTARNAIEIARSYGFDIKAGKWEKNFVLESIIQAREAAQDGRRSERAYFDCYMSQTARDHRVDSLAADQFERNAY